MSDQKYFDLHITGIGQLRRIRDVPTRGGRYTCCDIMAIHGPADAPERVRFDCKVMDSARADFDLIRVLVESSPDVQVGDKLLPPQVTVGFKLGDLTPETFTYSKGSNAGTTGVSFKTRLLKLTFAKLNGEFIELPSKAMESDTTGTDESHMEQQAA